MRTSHHTAKSNPTVPVVRPMGMELEIVGTAWGDHGCDEHTCCGEVLQEDVVICLRREQILISKKLGKGEKEEMVYTVNWVTDGHNRCRFGFLPRAYVAQGGMFDGVLCQVVGVGNESDNDKNERAARVQVISPLNLGWFISPLNSGKSINSSERRDNNIIINQKLIK